MNLSIYYYTSHTANRRTKTLDFRGFDSSRILSLRGEFPRPIGECPGKFGSTNLTRDNLIREIGRTQLYPGRMGQGRAQDNNKNNNNNNNNTIDININSNNLYYYYQYYYYY